MFNHLNGGGNVPRFIFDITLTTELTMSWAKVSGPNALSYKTSNAACVVNQWYFVAVTVDQAGTAGEICKFYRGTPERRAERLTTGTAIDGSTYLTNASMPFHLGSNTTTNMPGVVASLMMWPGVVLSHQQILAQQLSKRPIAGGCQLFSTYSDGNNRAWDYSGYGNHGAVQGTITSSPLNPPLLYSRTIRRKWFDVPAVPPAGTNWDDYGQFGTFGI
jgi:hypothetical protein